MLRRFSARDGFAEARAIYASGDNVTHALKAKYPDPEGFTDIVRVAYDLQSGTYVAALAQPGMAARKQAMARRILSFVEGLPVHSALEAGCGEATTLSSMMAERPGLRWSGFDLSLSRIAWAQSLLRSRDQQAELFVGDLLQIPLAGPAADLVITVHALEPNGDRAPALLAELLRVTGRYLLLVEPDYENARPEQRARMDQHGYIRGIEAALRASPGRILARAPLSDDVNPLNAATVTLFERAAPQPVDPQAAHLPYAPPGGGEPLAPVAGAWLSEANGHAWPALGGIPYLLPDGAVVASHLGRLA